MKKRSLAYILIMSIIIIFFIKIISAEKLEIQINNNYYPGEEINFKIILYDDNNNKIDGEISYEIQNFYTDVVSEGTTLSGENVIFKIPENAQKGYWAVIAEYGSLEKKQLFNIMEREKIDISLEGDTLIIRNLGNIPITSKQISISINDHHQTALVSLEIGQTKRIRLTAPDGEYKVRISDGTEENTFEREKVSLTGNVIGLESVTNKSFFQEYPLITLFLATLALFIIVILGLKFIGKNS